MVALKLPEREFKDLLNLVRERMKHVYRIIFIRYTFKKNQLLFKLLKTQFRILPSKSQYYIDNLIILTIGIY